MSLVSDQVQVRLQYSMHVAVARIIPNTVAGQLDGEVVMGHFIVLQRVPADGISTAADESAYKADPQRLFCFAALASWFVALGNVYLLL